MRKFPVYSRYKVKKNAGSGDINVKFTPKEVGNIMSKLKTGKYCGNMVVHGVYYV